MSKLIVCVVILACTCVAQEHFTCTRTNETLAEQSQQNLRTLQGPPGKRGPKGRKGPHGRKGQKGELGVCDDQQLNVLRHQINFLSQKVLSLQNQSSETEKLIVDIFSKGLYISPHIYIYELTPGSQSWQASRQFCQNWGGDLAVKSVKTLKHRIKIIENLSITSNFWIGASDIASEGNWTWINGENVRTSEFMWYTGEPNNHGGNQNCAILYSKHWIIPDGKADDTRCTSALHGLCEKIISV